MISSVFSSEGERDLHSIVDIPAEDSESSTTTAATTTATTTTTTTTTTTSTAAPTIANVSTANDSISAPVSPTNRTAGSEMGDGEMKKEGEGAKGMSVEIWVGIGASVICSVFFLFLAGALLHFYKVCGSCFILTRQMRRDASPVMKSFRKLKESESMMEEGIEMDDMGNRGRDEDADTVTTAAGGSSIGEEEEEEVGDEPSKYTQTDKTGTDGKSTQTEGREGGEEMQSFMKTGPSPLDEEEEVKSPPLATSTPRHARRRGGGGGDGDTGDDSSSSSTGGREEEEEKKGK